MLFALVVTSLAAEPVKLYVATLEASPKYAVEAKAWTQVLAYELRRWGARVTTQEDLVALATGNKQRQLLGCQDVDCGLDSDILMTADGMVSGRAAGDGSFMVSLTVMHGKPGKWEMTQHWANALDEESYSDPAEAIRLFVPKLVEQMRKDLEPGRLRDTPASAAEVGGPPAATPRRCSASGAEAALSLGALALLARARRRVTA